MGLKLSYNIFSVLLNKLFFAKWTFKSLLPIIIQEVLTKNIFMFAWMSNYSFLKTLSILLIYYYSRSKFNFWFKGLNSSNFQLLKYSYFDCDMDCVLMRIVQLNNESCHTNSYSCFFNKFI